MVQQSQIFGRVLEVIDGVGLNHSCTMGKAVILEGGLSDPVKAVQVPAFREASTGGTGFINGRIAQANMLPSRRALLAHIADVLQRQGAIIKNKEQPHGLTVDEIYHLIIEDQEVDLVLMPT